MEEGQSLEAHLQSVAELAGRFAAGFGAGSAGRLLGLTHDLGKAAPAFQRYLHDAHAGRPATKCPHSAPGAAAAMRELQDLLLIVLGHHGGLPAKGEGQTRIRQTLKDSEAEVAAAHELAGTMSLPAFDRSVWAHDPLELEMLLRMLLSALTDADRLDTEACYEAPSRGGHPEIAAYRDALDAHLARFEDDGREVTRIRREVSEACRARGAGAPATGGFYRLTVPTGGGKTLAGLRFALHHAAATGRGRVLFAIPYTSIIEQTAGVYRGIFGPLSPDAVLEHHASFEAEDAAPDGDGDEREIRRKLAAENWDHPLIVTTNAQLFDSLFSRRPSKVRKLHRLANAVLVLDEIQSLPADLLQPCLDALGWLVRHAGTTVVLCTATQPDYANVPELPAELREATEIAPDPPALFRALRRVEFEELGTLTAAQVADRLRAEPQVLAILDTKKDALAVLDALNDPAALHLSTLLCGAHRREVLAEVRRRLCAGEPVRLVATQVIEAGVDVDFPIVLRSRGPLFSIVQAAGRCNREGKGPELGRVGIFTLEGGGMPPGEYQTAAGIASLVVQDHLEELELPHVQADYFRRLLNPNAIGTDRKGNGGTVQGFRSKLDYPATDALARLIRDETTPVVITARLPEELRAEFETAWVPTRDLFRRLSPYTVALRERELARYRDDGLVRTGPTEVPEWTGGYHEVTGLGRGEFRPPEEYMA